MFSILAAYVPPFLGKMAARKSSAGVGSSRLARSLSRVHGGDGDAHLVRLARISADDEDERQGKVLRVLLRAMGL